MFGKNKFLIALIIIVCIFSFSLVSNAQETTPSFVDTDLDGLTDIAEVQKYKTDPNNADTDTDGVLDAQEVIDRTNPIDPKSNMLENYKDKAVSAIPQDTPIMWYLGRVSGIAAFVMFTLVVCMGLMMTSKFLLKFRFLSPAGALEAHSFNASFIAFLLVIVHIVSFMYDDIIQLNIKEALVPFVVQRNINSPLGWPLCSTISLGIIAFYLAIILVLTSRLRKRFVPLKIWRLTHYSSFLFYIMFVAHAYFGGSDSNEPWMRAIYLTSVSLVTILIILRIFGKKYFLPKPVATPVQPTTQIHNV